MEASIKADTTIFFHIPKTAGTTMDLILQRNYPAEAIFSTDFVNLGGVDKYQKLPKEKRAEVRLLKGHMNFGLHRFAPGSAIYFTLLRDPIDRSLSHYYHIRREQRHPAHPYVVENNMSIRESLDAGVDPLLFNAQTRLLSGVANSVPIGKCTEEHLFVAQQNLRQHFAVVGLTEAFDTTLLLLQRAFGWRNLFYESRNVAAERKRKTDLAPETLAALQKANNLDIRLYDYANSLFAEQVKAHGPRFNWVVWWYRQQNETLKRANRYYWRLRGYSLRMALRRHLAR